MKAKRKRIAGKGTMAAWSNGTRTHIGPTLARELGTRGGDTAAPHRRREPSTHGWAAVDTATMRHESLTMEAESDRLWQLDCHVESLRWLMMAAARLIDWDRVCPGPETNYYHSNLRLFRYMVSRCWERCREDRSLEPLFRDSPVYDDFLYMEELYADSKGTGRIG